LTLLSFHKLKEIKNSLLTFYLTMLENAALMRFCSTRLATSAAEGLRAVTNKAPTFVTSFSSWAFRPTNLTLSSKIQHRIPIATSLPVKIVCIIHARLKN
jgi:hypothetical protein